MTRKRRRKLIDVKVIRQEGPANLVEWLEGDHLKRVVVPVEAVLDGPKVDRAELDKGIEYGSDWTSVPGVDDRLVQELHRIGVWTKADLLAKSHLVRKAVQQAYVVPLVQALIEFAKED